MAATAVYARISCVERFDGVQSLSPPISYSNISATTAAFTIPGPGVYQIDVIGSTFGTVTLQRLGPDGSTYQTAATAFSASGGALVTLPAGQYKVALA